MNDNDVWISGTDIGHEGKFIWLSTGLPLVYKNFNSKRPNNRDGNDNCLLMSSHGKWNDIDCLYKYYFICEF